MEKLCSFISLSLVMFLASCSQDSVVEETTQTTGQGREVTISVGMADNSDARLIYDDLSGNFKWSADDKLYVMGLSRMPGVGNIFSNEVFTLVSGAGTRFAKFTGTVYNYDQVYMIKSNIYAFPDKVWPKDPQLPVDKMNEFTQHTDNPTGHIAKGIVIESDPNGNLMPEDFLASNFVMYPVQALFCIDLKSVPESVGDIKTATLTLKRVITPEYSGEQDRYCTLHISGKMQNGKLYFLVEIVAKYNYSDIQLVINSTHTATATLKNQRPFKPGQRYYYTATVAEGDGNLKFK